MILLAEFPVILLLAFATANQNLQSNMNADKLPCQAFSLSSQPPPGQNKKKKKKKTNAGHETVSVHS